MLLLPSLLLLQLQTPTAHLNIQQPKHHTNKPLHLPYCCCSPCPRIEACHPKVDSISTVLNSSTQLRPATCRRQHLRLAGWTPAAAAAAALPNSTLLLLLLSLRQGCSNAAAAAAAARRGAWCCTKAASTADDST
jgi:hypothetical protein